MPEAESKISPELSIREILDNPNHFGNWLFIHVTKTGESGGPETGIIAAKNPDYSTAEKCAYIYFVGIPIENRTCMRKFSTVQPQQQQ